MFKKILVPLDGSKTAEKVLPIVVDEARLHGAGVVLVRSIAPLRQSLMTSPSMFEQVLAQVENIAREYLAGIAANLEAEGLTVIQWIERGPPAKVILDVAKTEGCDLIIIGTHGETGAFGWRFGSIANKVVKARTQIPVMIAPS
ncbi:MAG: universal stress protein [Anaerolineales bacterium]|jgi:nucleotide-binding universal stress UspA family protein